MKSSSIVNPRLITLPSDLLVAQQTRNALKLVYKARNYDGESYYSYVRF